jgi:hypothetical protein
MQIFRTKSKVNDRSRRRKTWWAGWELIDGNHLSKWKRNFGSCMEGGLLMYSGRIVAGNLEL